MDKGAEFRLFPICDWESMSPQCGEDWHPDLREGGFIYLWHKPILDDCLFAGCWTLGWRTNCSTRGDGSQGTCEHWVPVWKPAPDTNSCWSLLDACWAKETQREDEDGWLKSESPQCRGYLFSVVPSIPQGAPLLTGFLMKTSLLPRDWEAIADGSFSRGWWEPWETACSQKLGRHVGMMLWQQAHGWAGAGGLLGKETGSLQWASEGGDVPRQKCLVTHPIPTVPGKYNKARGSQLCMHTGTFLFCIWCIRFTSHWLIHFMGYHWNILRTKVLMWN